jgi:hypothetical protein
MFVTPAQNGGERKRRAFALAFSVCRNAKKLLWPLPCADRGNRRPSSAAADEHARPCRHPRAQNGEPTFAANNPCDQRSRPEEALDRCARGADLGHPRKAQGSAAAVTTFTRSHLTRCLSRFGHPGNEPATGLVLSAFVMRNDSFGARRPVPPAKAERPLSVSKAVLCFRRLGHVGFWVRL